VEAQGQTGVKYLIVGVAGVIAILVAVKELGFTPTKITTPVASVELSGGLAPKPSQQSDPALAQNTSQLEARVRELESQLPSNQQQTPAPSNVVSDQNLQQPQPNQIPNVAGSWTGPYTMILRQQGASVVAQIFAFQNLVAAGRGTLSGRTLTVDYQNYLLVPGRFVASVSLDDKQLLVTDYGKGYPQPAVYNRSR
jgi:hypothetical protein